MLIPLALLLAAIYPSTPSPAAGHWEGTMQRGSSNLSVRVDFLGNPPERGFFSAPDLGAIDIPLSRLRQGRSLHWELAGDSSTTVFDATVNRNVMTGAFSDGGKAGSLRLRRLSASIARPYKEEPVSFQNGNARLAGTIFAPRMAGKHPATALRQEVRSWRLQLKSDKSLEDLSLMFSRSGLALEMSFSFPSRSVIAVLHNVAAIYGYPKYLRVDNGTELTSKLMQQWSEEHDVELLFIQPGKPTQNAYIESFNGRVRSELLNAYWFRTIAEAQTKGYAWMHDYNTTHSHSALGYHTPEEFLALYETTQAPQKSMAA